MKAHGPADLLLDSLAIRLTEGYEAAAPTLTRALAAVRNHDIGADDVDSLLWLAGNRAAGILAVEAWDYETGARLGRATSQGRTRVGSAGTAAVCLELSGEQRCAHGRRTNRGGRWSRKSGCCRS